jgi:D-alanyl-lipoteichoic acid acyltransferase DltB (MBOAT superfamily)
MLTMLLGGLWHGANWTFVAWGGLHGLYLWVEKFIMDRRAKDTQTAMAVGASGKITSIPETSPALPKLAPPSAAHLSRWTGWPYALFTFFLVNVTWVFFRASTFGGAGRILGAMFGAIHGGRPLLTTLAMLKIGIIISVMLIFHWLLRNTRVLDLMYRLPWWLTGLIWTSMVLLLILSQESSSSFIYFQF